MTECSKIRRQLSVLRPMVLCFCFCFQVGFVAEGKDTGTPFGEVELTTGVS